MFIPREDSINGAIAAATGVPTTLLALSLSQTEIALLAILVNVLLAFGLKIFDIVARILVDRAARRGRD
jgi:hypothetical protein